VACQFNILLLGIAGDHARHQHPCRLRDGADRVPGRKAPFRPTLIVMLVPSTALVLLIFLELSAVRPIGNPPR
jgi:hypothetical protein